MSFRDKMCPVEHGGVFSDLFRFPKKEVTSGFIVRPEKANIPPVRRFG